MNPNFNIYKDEDEKEDELIIVPLGSGCEVGRSCILMKFKGKKIMVANIYFNLLINFDLLYNYII